MSHHMQSGVVKWQYSTIPLYGCMLWSGSPWLVIKSNCEVPFYFFFYGEIFEVKWNRVVKFLTEDFTLLVLACIQIVKNMKFLVARPISPFNMASKHPLKLNKWLIIKLDFTVSSTFIRVKLETSHLLSFV